MTSRLILKMYHLNCYCDDPHQWHFDISKSWSRSTRSSSNALNVSTRSVRFAVEVSSEFEVESVNVERWCLFTDILYRMATGKSAGLESRKSHRQVLHQFIQFLCGSHVIRLDLAIIQCIHTIEVLVIHHIYLRNRVL